MQHSGIMTLTLLIATSAFAQTQRTAPPTATKASAAAPDKLPQYTVGSGGKFHLLVGKDPTEVTIGFVESSASKLVFEVQMKSLNDDPKLNVQMQQQFHLGLEGGKVKILKGLMKIPMVNKPQILPPEYLQGYDGAQVSSFLIGSKTDLNGKKVGVEQVTTPAGTFSATHYRQTENGQTVDYWLADNAKPLGLVKIESTGKTATQNYQMTFEGAVSGVKPQINANDAEPLNDAAKMYLPLLMPNNVNNL